MGLWLQRFPEGAVLVLHCGSLWELGSAVAASHSGAWRLEVGPEEQPASETASALGTFPHMENEEPSSLRKSQSFHLLNKLVARTEDQEEDVFLPFRDAISGSIWLLLKPSSLSSEGHRLDPSSRHPVPPDLSLRCPR